MHISIEKTEASAYRAWVSASEWLALQVTHGDGSWVKESVGFKHLGQKEKRDKAHRRKPRPV